MNSSFRYLLPSEKKKIVDVISVLHNSEILCRRATLSFGSLAWLLFHCSDTVHSSIVVPTKIIVGRRTKRNNTCGKNGVCGVFGLMPWANWITYSHVLGHIKLQLKFFSYFLFLFYKIPSPNIYIIEKNCKRLSVRSPTCCFQISSDGFLPPISLCKESFLRKFKYYCSRRNCSISISWCLSKLKIL